jgi:colanic acid/amylovoran biosynthesis glycosyltransferase
MRIAFLLRHFPALSETFVLNQITGLIDRGHDVDIFAESPREHVLHPDIERYGLLTRTHYWPRVPTQRSVRWLKGVGLFAREAASRPRVARVIANVAAYGRESLSMRLAYSAWPVVDGRRYDVIQCHFGPMGIRGMALRDMGLLEGTLITSFHGYDLSRTLRTDGIGMYSRLFTRGDFFLPVSDRWRQRLIELGCAPAKIVVHRMGIDCRQFLFSARHPAADGVLRLVSVARLVEKKGIEHAIRAVATLAAAGRRILYTIVGDGPLAADLARVAAGLHVSHVVQLLGNRPQPDVIRILGDAHLLVVPSVVAGDGDEEGIPVVLMEAMAMGLPVVATRHSGIPELVEHGVSGLLVPERDVEALARAIAEIADVPGQWPRFGHAGRARVVAQHNIETLNDLLVTLYQRAVRRYS